MKKTLILSLLVGTTFVLQAQSLVGNQLKSKESIVLYLLEQEKLAHNFYSILDTIWVTEIFNRVASEERIHMQKLSIVAYDFMIEVPSHFNEYPLGQYSNPYLRALYPQLLQEANFSLEDAYRVSANLEERKIIDLKAALKQPNFESEALTYKALLLGAEDNFKLFIRALVGMQAEYQPILLNLGEYEFITKNILPNDTEQKRINLNVKTQSRIGLF